jgi:hypothetical protein
MGTAHTRAWVNVLASAESLAGREVTLNPRPAVKLPRGGARGEAVDLKLRSAVFHRRRRISLECWQRLADFSEAESPPRRP